MQGRPPVPTIEERRAATALYLDPAANCVRPRVVSAIREARVAFAANDGECAGRAIDEVEALVQDLLPDASDKPRA